MLGYNKWKKLNEDLDALGGAFGGVRSPNVIGKIMGRAPGMGEDPIEDDDPTSDNQFSPVDTGDDVGSEMDDEDMGDETEVEEVCVEHPKYGIVCGKKVEHDNEDEDEDEGEEEDHDEGDDEGEDGDIEDMGDHDDNVDMEVSSEDDMPNESYSMKKKKCYGGKMMSKKKCDSGKMMSKKKCDYGSKKGNMYDKIEAMKKGDKNSDMETMEEWKRSVYSMLEEGQSYDGAKIIKNDEKKKESKNHEKKETASEKVAEHPDLAEKLTGALDRHMKMHGKKGHGHVAKVIKEIFKKLSPEHQARVRKSCGM